MRRPPEKGMPLLKHWLEKRWNAGLEAWQVWVVLFLALSIWSLLPRRFFEVPRLEPGSIAGRTYIADRDLSVVNEAATQILQERAEEETPPVYDFNRGLERERYQQLTDLFEAGRAALEAAEETPDEPSANPRPASESSDDEAIDLAPDLVQQLTEASGLNLDLEQVEWLQGREFRIDLEDRLKGLQSRVLRGGVVSDRALVLANRVRGITVQELPSGQRRLELDLYSYLDYPDQVREVVELELRSWEGLRSADRKLLTGLIMATVAPNLTLNSSESFALQAEAAASVGTVTHNIRKGEVIVRKNGKVNELDARAIAEMASSREDWQLWLAGLGTLLLVGAAAWLTWLFTGLESRSDRSRMRLFNECLILLTLYVLGIRFAFFVAEAISKALPGAPWNEPRSYTYAIPFAALALLAMLLYGRGLAFALALVFSVFVGHIAGGETIWTMTLYSLAGSLAAVFVLERYHFTQRTVMIRAGAVVGLVNIASVLTLRTLTGEIGGGPAQLAFDLLCAFVGGLLVAGVTSFAVPVFETLLAITTHIKLLELSSTNLPLLRRLALEAPGTFQHSLAVANLSKAGCEAIDLDSVLTHTAALYHDIGKIFRPQYFIENQAPGQNPHDKIQPSMSALILINHVKEGRELAAKHHLPKPIVDAIEQHHGTNLIKFFYGRAMERCDPETEEVREDDFRYPGPKPQSKEMGLLLLADAVEAASRTLVEPTRQKIRGLVRTLFDDALKDNQLDHTDLTLGDLARVEEAFVNVLTKIYHRRIDYPGFDFNQPQGAKSSKSGEHPTPKSGAFPPKKTKNVKERKAS
jgi:putative nucleotidyltransferase with HDIG domain